jgi:hypothetical protein
MISMILSSMHYFKVSSQINLLNFSKCTITMHIIVLIDMYYC